MSKYTLEAGRCILRDGKRILTVNRVTVPSDEAHELAPYEADDYARRIVQLLNAAPELLAALRDALAYIMRAMPPGGYIAAEKLRNAIELGVGP